MAAGDGSGAPAKATPLVKRAKAKEAQSDFILRAIKREPPRIVNSGPA
jgi:hypothetical protein